MMLGDDAFENRFTAAIEKIKFQQYKAPDKHILINGLYKVNKKLGSGSFGVLYQGVDTRTGEEVAIKLESTRVRHKLLDYEA